MERYVCISKYIYTINILSNSFKCILPYGKGGFPGVVQVINYRNTFVIIISYICYHHYKSKAESLQTQLFVEISHEHYHPVRKAC